jgi:hypothetical protein
VALVHSSCLWRLEMQEGLQTVREISESRQSRESECYGCVLENETFRNDTEVARVKITKMQLQIPNFESVPTPMFG